MFDDEGYSFNVYRPRTTGGMSSVIGFLVLMVGLAAAFGFVLAHSPWLNPLLDSQLDTCRQTLTEVQTHSKALQDQVTQLQQHIHELENAPAQQSAPLLLPATAVIAFSLFAVAAVLLYRTLLPPPAASRRHLSGPRRPLGDRHLIAPPPRTATRTQTLETDEEKAERASRLMHFHH